jgi:hypothetical protein
MKANARSICLLAAALLVFASCSGALASKSSGEATVTISMSLPASSSTSASERSKSLSIANVSITAHFNDSSSVADSVIAVSASGTSAVATLSLMAGSWTFTAKGFDSNGYETCSGSTTVSLASGSQSISLVLLEESGTIAVTATLPATVTSDYCVATAIRADWTAISGGFASSSPSTKLIEIPVGSWTVVVTGSDSSGTIYQGATTVTVENGTTASAAVTVSGTAVTPQAVFVSNPASDLYNTLWNARKAISTLYQPLQYRFASGTFTPSTRWWDVPFASYSGGWSDASTQTSAATVLKVSASSNLGISARSPCDLESMTVDGQGGWCPLRIQNGSFATINKVTVVNAASVNPNNAAALGPRALGIYDGSSVTMTDCTMAGIFDYGAPSYSPDHRLVIKDSSFVGGGGSVGYGDLFLSNVKLNWTLSDGWDASTTGRALLNCYYSKIVDIENSTLSLSMGSNTKSGSSCTGLGIGNSYNSKTQVILKGDTFNYGASGGMDSNFYAIHYWGIASGSSVDIENNVFAGTSIPSQTSSSTVFIGLHSSDACTNRNDILVDISGNTFYGTAKATDNSSLLAFVLCGGSTSPPSSTLDVFKNNTFYVTSGGTRASIILYSSNSIDAYASNAASLVNDPTVTTYLDASTVSGNTVIAQ